jgi:hypothetical protein
LRLGNDTGRRGRWRRWEIQRAFVPDWTRLRRVDHAAARRQLDRADGGGRPEERLRPLCFIFERGPNPPQAPEEFAEETAEKIPNIYGLPPEPPCEMAADKPESEPVRPGKTNFDMHSKLTSSLLPLAFFHQSRSQ